MAEKNEKTEKALEELTKIIDREGLQLQVEQRIVLLAKE